MSKQNYKNLRKYLNTSSDAALYAEMPVSKFLQLFPSAKVNKCYESSYGVLRKFS